MCIRDSGTRLQIVKMYTNNISARVLTGDKLGDIVFIPRIKLDTGESSNLPFVLPISQFPVTLAFAITINKAQGQSFLEVGLYLNKPLFSHGQLYVALSRCSNKDRIKIEKKRGD